MQADQSLPFRKTAKNLVFGEGSLNPKIYILGEAPGRTEDETGQPFVGRSGKFLRELITSIGFDPLKDVYITSVVRFRPPENKTPTPKQVAAYEKYINLELQIIKPKLIVTVGGVSLKKFSREPITKIHAKPMQVSWLGARFTLVPMFHPAAALRNPAIKRAMIRDFQKLKALVK
ncbi:MAG: uracil-DNA glycosylase [Candidatus Doudnabacteria bacterium]|nr:uracil-DNA glycosylase [Candidatus Doudnabacteria bacterium]